MDIIWRPSPNYGRPIRYIIIHGSGKRCDEEVLQTLCNKGSSVSSHYFISSKGDIYQLVKDNEIAWHAGVSKWGSDHSLNFTSIGIELFNSSAGNETPYTSMQYSSLVSLLEKLIGLYAVKLENILGHSEISPDRRSDPGIFFDWERLYRSNVARPTKETNMLRILHSSTLSM